MKAGYHSANHGTKHRILFAPDHKIANKLLKLAKHNPKYKIFIPEFPVLHLIFCRLYGDVVFAETIEISDDESNTKVENIQVCTQR